MGSVPITVQKRLKAEIPKFQKILRASLDRDINEADTVIIITDMLERVFGFDKYEDLTREYAISGTFVDLAVISKSKIDYLIEVKAIGISLKDSHLRQAINYASKEGVKWTVLTNGIEWEVHRIIVDGQVSNENVFKFNFLELSSRSKTDLEMIFLLCKKGMDKDLIEEFYEHKQIFNRFTIGAILTNDEIIKNIRRILRRISPGLKADEPEILEKVMESVIKREVIESDSGVEAQKLVKKLLTKFSRKKKTPKKRNTYPTKPQQY